MDLLKVSPLRLRYRNRLNHKEEIQMSAHTDPKPPVS